MAKVEIEEADLLTNNQIVASVRAMLGNKEARQHILRAQKIITPNASIPEIDARAPVDEALGEVNKTVAALQKRIDDDKAERDAEKRTNEFKDSWEKQKRDLLAQGWSEEGIAKAEEHAQKEGIPSLRAAANDFLALNPPPPPATPSSAGSFGMFDAGSREGEHIKKIFESKGGDDMAVNSIVNETLAEMRGQARR